MSNPKRYKHNTNASTALRQAQKPTQRPNNSLRHPPTKDKILSSIQRYTKGTKPIIPNSFLDLC